VELEAPELLETRRLEGRDDEMSGAVLLGVEERVRHAERYLVPQLRGAEGVAEHEHVGHAGHPI
jgi:hypothetical protein